MVAKKEACGLACPGDVEKLAESHRQRRRIYDFYDLRVEFSVNGSIVFEIVKGMRRITETLDPMLVDELYRAMLDELGGKLLGGDAPSMAALYTLKALLGAAAGWLRAVSRRRAELERRLREARARLAERRELEKRLAELQARGSDDAEAQREAEALRARIASTTVCWGGRCTDPAAAEKRIAMQLREVLEAERRIAIAATALSHAWRALTHPSIDDLEQHYRLPG